jgi:hypothetical protein
MFFEKVGILIISSREDDDCYLIKLFYIYLSIVLYHIIVLIIKNVEDLFQI